MAPTIYFVRHGETDWNREGRLQGRMDIPINETGRAQALRNGGVLADVLEKPEALDFVASPLLRTCQTMAIMRGVIGLEREAFERDHRLIEIGFGDWEGRSWAELHAAEAKAIRARKADPFNFVVPGGESYAMVMRRVEGWIRTLKRDVVVCSHGGVMRCVRGYFEQADEKAIPHLEVPQDVVMMIEDGAIRWL